MVNKFEQPSAYSVAFDSSVHTWLFRVDRNRSAISIFCAEVAKRLPSNYASEFTLRAFQVTFDELLTSVVEHADGPSDQPIEVLLKRNPDDITAVIRYQSSCYDPTSYQPEVVDGSILNADVDSLGIKLVQNLMHNFEHRYENGSNIITLMRRKD
jgi:anti-sigma regulatory factor (Ser/Thr protein kinase)